MPIMGKTKEYSIVKGMHPVDDDSDDKFEDDLDVIVREKASDIDKRYEQVMEEHEQLTKEKKSKKPKKKVEGYDQIDKCLTMMLRLRYVHRLGFLGPDDDEFINRNVLPYQEQILSSLFMVPRCVLGRRVAQLFDPEMYLVSAFLPFNRLPALDGELLLGLGPRWLLALGNDLELVAGTYVGDVGDALH